MLPGLRGAYLIGIFGFNLSALSPGAIGRLATQPIDAIASKVASALGGKCWSVASWAVQVRGKPMCLAGSGDPDFDAGRGARAAAVKALGMTFAAFSVRQSYETTTANAEQHIQSLASLIHAALDRRVQLVLPSSIGKRLITPSDADRAHYVINGAALDMLASVRGRTQGGDLTLTDPYEAALVTRTLTASSSLEQAASDVAAALDPRAQAVMTNAAGETETARLGTDATAARTYLDGARTATRGGALELDAHLTLKRELRAQVSTTVRNTILPGGR